MLLEYSEGSDRGGREVSCCLLPIIVCYLLRGSDAGINGTKSVENGVRMREECLQNIGFADDQGMAADAKESRQRVLDSLPAAAEAYSMKTNIMKKYIHCGVDILKCQSWH